MVNNSIKNYIDNSDPDDDNALSNIRCGSCNNSLIHCGNYTISTLEGGYEGLLCQDCLRLGRKVSNAIIISEDGNKISYIELPKEQPLKQQQEQTDKPKPRILTKKKEEENDKTNPKD